MKTPSMFDTTAGFAGITLSVDPIDRPRTDGSDNVMAMFHEEQPMTWHFAKPFIAKALAKAAGKLGFLDVGTGSGVFSILVDRHFPGTWIHALDKSPRAVIQACKNAAANGISFETARFVHQEYQLDSCFWRSAKVIGLYPPYHLYPEEVAEKIPQHARGGSDGQEEFKNQLAIANSHLASDGVIFINQMCLGSENGPDFLEYIPKLIVGEPSITFTNVFPRMRTEDFLRGVYGDRHPDYVQATAEKSPWLYYCVAVVTRDGKGEIQEVSHDFDLAGRTWQDRIDLHREIAGHEQS